MEHKKVIYCEKCVGEIKNKNDLVVTNYLFKIVPYHNKCFAQVIKSGETMFVGNNPVNGSMSNIWAVVSLVLGSISLFFSEIRYLAIPFFLYIVLKLYVWIKYERHL